MGCGTLGNESCSLTYNIIIETLSQVAKLILEALALQDAVCQALGCVNLTVI